MSEEDFKNLQVLVEAGARSIVVQSSLEQGGGVLLTANALLKKMSELVTKGDAQ